ncbi:hypothetical protein DPMN_086042 [Dreissena polymorpha]|uniref:Uncharacterized protein n=1 Tax=Dreissena polymorpha TaxID=45954 RepID=A0A9D3YEU5_DREPO|nr:hypothetical protein DPMN_086042 [Dreissena polymorpha]
MQRKYGYRVFNSLHIKKKFNVFEMVIHERHWLNNRNCSLGAYCDVEDVYIMPQLQRL